jgi:hypothetical protein
MRVSRNQDWIGKICGFIAGAPEDGSATTTAELWAPPIPPGKPEPVHPDPQRAEVMYGAMVLARFSGPLRAASSNLRRVRLCLS